MNVFLNYRHVQFVKITLPKFTIFLYNFKYNENFSLYLYYNIYLYYQYKQSLHKHNIIIYNKLFFFFVV
ncbi:194R [Invertebrate iridescent virus Kaz2018]|nr:194R [Invertebrate iridescent virus Kaz2018]